MDGYFEFPDFGYGDIEWNNSALPVDKRSTTPLLREALEDVGTRTGIQDAASLNYLVYILNFYQELPDPVLLRATTSFMTLNRLVDPWDVLLDSPLLPVIIESMEVYEKPPSDAALLYAHCLLIELERYNKDKK